MPADAAASSPSVSDLQQRIEVLEAELRTRVSEQAALTSQLADQNSTYSERQVHQVATNEVLAAMAASPTDPQPVFDLITTRARDICGSYGVSVMEFDGVMVRLRAWTGVSDDPAVRDAYVAQFPRLPDRTRAEGRAILDGQVVHVRDYQNEHELRLSPGSTTVKSNVAVPMRRGTEVIGAVVIGSRDVGGFSESQVELLKTFAEQAVIAITSAAAHREQREALERQTATADILRVISQSPTNVQPVFDAIAESALRLLNGWSIVVWRYDGERLRAAVARGGLPGSSEALLRMLDGMLFHEIAPFIRDALRDCRVAQIADVESSEFDLPTREMARMRGWRANVAIPMLKDGQPIGLFSLSRTEPGGCIGCASAPMAISIPATTSND